MQTTRFSLPDFFGPRGRSRDEDEDDATRQYEPVQRPSLLQAQNGSARRVV